jgi:hypothetical protein
MVDFALTVEDQAERNLVAKSIIAIMGNMYPHLRDVSDFRHKLWDHLAIMSDFKLDIDSPYETPTKEKLQEKPDKLPYNNQRIKYRHYGKTIEALIAKAIEIEEPKEKEALILMIANHMKKSFINWNKDHVPDEKIFQDIIELSEGQLQVTDEMKLRENKEREYTHKRKNNNNHHHHRKQFNDRNRKHYKK